MVSSTNVKKIKDGLDCKITQRKKNLTDLPLNQMSSLVTLKEKSIQKLFPKEYIYKQSLNFDLKHKLIVFLNDKIYNTYNIEF